MGNLMESEVNCSSSSSSCGRRRKSRPIHYSNPGCYRDRKSQATSVVPCRCQASLRVTPDPPVSLLALLQIDNPSSFGALALLSLLSVSLEERMKIGGQKQNCYFQPPANDSHGCLWLLILHAIDGHRQTFCDIIEDRYYTRIIPDMLNQRTRPTSLEWTVLEDCDSEECCLWNPSSMEKVQLPRAQGVAPDRCFLSSSPRDPHCIVFLIDIDESTVWFCGLGDDAFRKQKVEHDDGGRLARAALYKGEMHLLTWKCNLVKLDLVGSELRWTQFTSPDFSHLLPTWSHACRHFLVPTEDELLLVRATYVGGSIPCSNLSGFLVLRMNFDNHTWEKLSNIGARTIFISNRNCLSEDCRGKLKRNCIYYAMSGDRRLYLYDLEDESISVSLPCPIADRRTALEWIMM